MARKKAKKKAKKTSRRSATGRLSPHLNEIDTTSRHLRDASRALSLAATRLDRTYKRLDLLCQDAIIVSTPTKARRKK
jgi:hypothetical protein